MSIASPVPPEPDHTSGPEVLAPTDSSAPAPPVVSHPSDHLARGDVPRRSLGLMAGVVLLLLAGFALLDLLLQNSHHARFHFFWLHADLSLSALVFASAFVAVVLDETVGLVWRRRRRRLLNLEEGTTRPRRHNR